MCANLKRGADYNNHARLIEVVVHFHLPTGRSRALRALLDTGASDNYANEKTMKELGLKITKFQSLRQCQWDSQGLWRRLWAKRDL